MAKPEDPARTSIVLCYPDADEDPDGYGIRSALHTPRATAQAQFARNYGYNFADVSCRKGYYRPLSRQEVWDEYGMYRWEDAFVDDQGRGQDDLLDAGLPVPPTPAQPPDDWEASDDDPAYTFCEPDHWDARPVWVCVA